MTTQNTIGDLYTRDNIIYISGFDTCLVGVDITHSVALYGYEQMINQLMDEGMSEQEAEEYIDYNITGAYLGDGMPQIVSEL